MGTAKKIVDEFRYGSRFICANCRVAKRKEDFSFTRTGKRELNCQVCCRKKLRESKKQQEREAAEQAIRQLVSHIKGTKIEAPHISELTAKLISKLGGIDAFIERWVVHLDAVLAERPDSKIAHDNFRAIAQLIKQSSELRSTAPDVASLTDEELAEELRAYINTYGLQLYDPDELAGNEKTA